MRLSFKPHDLFICLSFICMSPSWVSALGVEEIRDGDIPSWMERRTADFKKQNVYGPIELRYETFSGKISLDKSKDIEVELHIMIPKCEHDRYDLKDTDKLAFFQINSVDDNKTYTFDSIGVIDHTNPVTLRRKRSANALKKRTFIDVRFSAGGNVNQNYNSSLLRFIKRITQSKGDLFVMDLKSIEFSLLGEVEDEGASIHGIAYVEWDTQKTSRSKEVAQFHLKGSKTRQSVFSKTSDSSAKTKSAIYKIEFDGDNTSSFTQQL